MMIGSIQVIKHLRYSTVSIPPSYEESFRKAILTFQHQRVYDPINEDIVHLSDISDNIGDDLDFLGPYPLLTTHLVNSVLCMLFALLASIILIIP